MKTRCFLISVNVEQNSSTIKRVAIKMDDDVIGMYGMENSCNSE